MFQRSDVQFIFLIDFPIMTSMSHTSVTVTEMGQYEDIMISILLRLPRFCMLLWNLEGTDPVQKPSPLYSILSHLSPNLNHFSSVLSVISTLSQLFVSNVLLIEYLCDLCTSMNTVGVIIYWITSRRGLRTVKW